MAFDEVQFPTKISYGSRGGPRFLTDIAGEANAFESRTAIWQDSAGTYNARYGVKTLEQLLEVITFFYARSGRLIGFRYKDWLDYTATDEPLEVLGSNQLQLTRTYASGPRSLVRPIRKPIAPITMRRNSVDFTAFTLDTVTGTVTLTPEETNPITDSSVFAITGISQSNPAVVTTAVNTYVTDDILTIANVGGMIEIVDGEYPITVLTPSTFELTGIDSTLFTPYTAGGTTQQPGISRSDPARIRSVGHPFITGEVVFLTNVLGMTEINAQFAEVTVIDADRLLVDLDTSAFSPYSSSGDVEKYLQPGIDVMDWTGEFDVPVRFETDSLQASIDAFDIGAIPDIPLTELFND